MADGGRDKENKVSEVFKDEETSSMGSNQAKPKNKLVKVAEVKWKKTNRKGSLSKTTSSVGDKENVNEKVGGAFPPEMTRVEVIVDMESAKQLLQKLLPNNDKHEKEDDTPDTHWRNFVSNKLMYLYTVLSAAIALVVLMLYFKLVLPVTVG